MGLIKSALELAMERAESVPADHQALLRDELHKKGVKLAVQALSGEVRNLQEALQKFPAAEYPDTQAGALKVLMNRLVLPQTPTQLEAMTVVKEPLQSLCAACAAIVDKIYQISQDYLAHREQVKNQLDQQFQPLIKQKEAQISEKTGRRVRLSAENIPEIQAAYKEQMHAVEDHYRSGIDQLRWQLSQLLQPHSK